MTSFPYHILINNIPIQTGMNVSLGGARINIATFQFRCRFTIRTSLPYHIPFTNIQFRWKGTLFWVGPWIPGHVLYLPTLENGDDKTSIHNTVLYFTACNLESDAREMRGSVDSQCGPRVASPMQWTIISNNRLRNFEPWATQHCQILLSTESNKIE